MSLLTLQVLAQAAPQAAPLGGSGLWLIWGIVLLAAALALFFVEVFLPTGGVVGALAGLAAVTGIVMFFRVDTTLGLISATACVIALPFLIGFALKIWPNTPFGKWVILDDQQTATTPRNADTATDDSSKTTSATKEKIAVGDTGKTVTPLFPVGTCVIHGRREECLAKHGTIPAGTAVRVVIVDGGEVYVAAVEG